MSNRNRVILLLTATVLICASALVLRGLNDGSNRESDSTEGSSSASSNASVGTASNTPNPVDLKNSDPSLITQEPAGPQSAVPFAARFRALEVAYERAEMDVAWTQRNILAQHSAPGFGEFWSVFEKYILRDPARLEAVPRFLDELLAFVGRKTLDRRADTTAERRARFSECERIARSLISTNPNVEAERWYASNPGAEARNAVPEDIDHDTWCIFSVLGNYRQESGPTELEAKCPIAAMLSDGNSARVLRPQIATCKFLARRGARQHIEDIRRLSETTKCDEVRRECLNALVALGEADSLVAVELALQEQLERGQWKELCITIEDVAENHPNLAAILPGVSRAISTSPGLKFQRMSVALTTGLNKRRNRGMSDAQRDRLDLLEMALGTRCPRVWYDLGISLARSFYPNAPEVLLKHMRDLLLHGFDSVGDEDIESMACAHVLTVFLVLTDDVAQTMELVRKAVSSRVGGRVAVQYFLNGTLEKKFLSGKSSDADIRAVCQFLPEYCIEFMDRVDATTEPATLPSARKSATTHLRPLWLMLQPPEAGSVTQLISSNALATAEWQSEFFLDTLLAYEDFRAQCASGKVERPDWPVLIPRHQWAK